MSTNAPTQALPPRLAEATPWQRLEAARARRRVTGIPAPRDLQEADYRAEQDVQQRRRTVVSRTARNVGNAIDAAVPDPVQGIARRLPTPGGLFPLIVVALLLLFAVVPMKSNGDTRLKLLWKALTGGVELPCTEQGAARKASKQDAVKSVLQAATGQADQQIAADLLAVEQVAATTAQGFWFVHPLG